MTASKEVRRRVSVHGSMSFDTLVASPKEAGVLRTGAAEGLSASGGRVNLRTGATMNGNEETCNVLTAFTVM